MSSDILSNVMIYESLFEIMNKQRNVEEKMQCFSQHCMHADAKTSVVLVTSKFWLHILWVKEQNIF